MHTYRSSTKCGYNVISACWFCDIDTTTSSHYPAERTIELGKVNPLDNKLIGRGAQHRLEKAHKHYNNRNTDDENASYINSLKSIPNDRTLK